MSASAWLAASALAVAATLASCGGGESSVATPTPAVPETPSPRAAAEPVSTPTPTAPSTVEPSPTAVRTPPPTASPTPAREASPAATPSPPPTAAASPTPTPEPVVIEYIELTLGEPSFQPPGYVLFSGLRGCFWNCQGSIFGVVRTVFDEGSGTLLVEDPLASLADIGFYFSFGVSDSGGRMAAARCLVGECYGLYGTSGDAEEELWVSDDGGRTWTSWGALAPPSWIVRVTDEDVAVLERAPERSRVRWVRSGQLYVEPEDNDYGWVSGWDGAAPIWGKPETPTALTDLVDWTWSELQARPDSSTVWWATKHADLLLLLAVVNAQGMVEEVYGWPNADYVDWLVPMGDGLFAGFRMEGGYVVGIDQLNFLIDLERRTVHPLLGLPDGEEGFAEPWRAVPLPAD